DTIPSAISYLYASKIITPQNNANVDVNAELLKLFLSLQSPLKAVNLKPNKRLQNNDENQHQFPTFVKILKEPRLQSDELLYDECKNVESYLKVGEFKKDIDDFFQSNNQHRLMLQYQHKSNDLTQYFQIKSILENAHHTYSLNNRNNPKLIIFIVYNMRILHPFPIIFSRKWKMVFIESLTSDAPTLLKELCAPNSLPIEQIAHDQSSAHVHIYYFMLIGLQCGFYRLKFSNLIKVRFELTNLFGSRLLEMQNVMLQRLQRIIRKTALMDDLILDFSFQQTMQTKQRNNYTKECQFVVDSVTQKKQQKKIFLQAIQNKTESTRQLENIFLQSAGNASLIPLIEWDEVWGKQLHLYNVKVDYEALFPFSWNFHVWCFERIDKILDMEIFLFSTITHTNFRPKNNTISSNEDVEKSANRLRNILQTCNEPFTLLNKCNHQNCEYYTKDVIRGKYHMYIKLQGDDQLCACIKGIVFCMVWLVSGKNNRIHIPMIESVFYHFDNVIVQFVLLLSLCKNDINLSDIIETLSKADKKPLDQLMAVAVTLTNYFLECVPQENALQEFMCKMAMACDAVIIILKFWREKQKQNKIEIKSRRKV
ncbi:hypothetical protein RFI_34425, partial [Reticulomyxa filosa]